MTLIVMVMMTHVWLGGWNYWKSTIMLVEFQLPRHSQPESRKSTNLGQDRVYWPVFCDNTMWLTVSCAMVQGMRYVLWWEKLHVWWLCGYIVGRLHLVQSPSLLHHSSIAYPSVIDIAHGLMEGLCQATMFFTCTHRVQEKTSQSMSSMGFAGHHDCQQAWSMVCGSDDW